MQPQLEIRRYTPQERTLWDSIIKNAANATFLFLRDYMEYHADRFVDFSLMIFDKSRLIAILPASRHNNNVVSHGGLTYGGIITQPQVSSLQLLHIFECIKQFLRKEGIENWIYKPVPHIYHKYPHEAELYALYRSGAIRTACNLSSTIDLTAPLPYSQLRRRGIKKAVKSGITISSSDRYAEFWEILEANLQERHSVTPVHTLQEITYLHNLFPQNIQLHTATIDNEVLAGCLIYNTGEVAHAQYISASPKGKELGALDMLFDNLISSSYTSCRYFDFGISTEDNGNYLNQGLLSQKEGFGARGCVYETYLIEL